MPPDLFEISTVWIGEVENAVTYPTLLTEKTKPERVVLVLDAISDSVTGTVTFGEEPEGPPPPDVVVLAMNWEFSPFPGFAYTIVSSELRGDRLALYFIPAEFGCAEPTAGAECDCTGSDCVPDGHITRKLDLVVTGETMAGQLTRPAGNWLGGVPAIRLDRVQ